MNFELLNRPSSTVAKVTLSPHEHLVAEGGSMVAMRGSVRIETTTHSRGSGGVFNGLKRMLSGESFFLNHFYSDQSEDEVWLSQPLPGDMEVIPMTEGSDLIVAGGSFVACPDTVKIDMSFQGLRSLFSGENLFWIRLSGKGSALVSSYGCIYSVLVEDEYIVDTGHIVAYEESLKFEITKLGSSWLHSFLGGEGLVCRFKGKGRVWCQSHNPQELGHTLGPRLKPRKSHL